MANASSAGLGKWLDSGLVWWNHDNWPDSRSSSPSQVFSTTTSNSAACTRSPSLHRDRSTLAIYLILDSAIETVLRDSMASQFHRSVPAMRNFIARAIVSGL